MSFQKLLDQVRSFELPKDVNEVKELMTPKNVSLALLGLSTTYYLTKYSMWRWREKSNRFNAYTTAEQAIDNVDLTGKLAIVTGCNAGIGKETARVLAKQGCTVIMACRSLDKANKARDDIINNLSLSQSDANDRVIIMKLDLSSLESVKQFATEFNQKNLKIDYLVNNAGIMALPEYRETKDGFEMQFGTNHLGHYYLTKLLLPSLFRTTGGNSPLPRVINLSSLGHFYLRDYNYAIDLFNRCKQAKTFMSDKNEYDAWLNYGISKSCNILFGRELQKRYSDKLISVSLHPGAINTELSRNMSLSDGLRFMAEFMSNPLDMVRSAKSIEQGAATTIRCLAMSSNEIQGGHYYFNCQSGDDNGELTGACLYDKENGQGKLSELLWELSDVLLESKGF